VSVFTAIAASAKPGTAAGPASAIVSGAGTAAANGTYTQRGESGGRPYYNLEGQPDSTTLSCIVAVFDTFEIHGGDGTILYSAASGELAFPWLAEWVEVDGTSPAPIVTQG
jgi:hypothetical protein